MVTGVDCYATVNHYNCDICMQNQALFIIDICFSQIVLLTASKIQTTLFFLKKKSDYARLKNLQPTESRTTTYQDNIRTEEQEPWRMEMPGQQKRQVWSHHGSRPPWQLWSGSLQEDLKVAALHPPSLFNPRS